MTRSFPHSEIDLALDADAYGTRYTPAADIPAEHLARLLDDPAAAGLSEEPTRDERHVRTACLILSCVIAVIGLFAVWQLQDNPQLAVTILQGLGL